MASLRKTMNKLQLALNKRGECVKINQYQSYSEKSERMVTKFVILKSIEQDGKRKNKTILETYQLADVVRKLAEMYGGDGP